MCSASPSRTTLVYEINKSVAIWVQERSGCGDSKPACLIHDSGLGAC